MEKQSVSPNNSELLRMIQELEFKIKSLEYTVQCLKAEQERLARQRY